MTRSKGQGSVRFHVLVDGKPAADTAVLHGGDAPKLLSVDLTGAKQLRPPVDDADDGIDQRPRRLGRRRADPQPRRQGEAADRFRGRRSRRRTSAEPSGPKPAIHYPRIVGATPGRPFLFLIPATGEEPLTFTAENLPAGITLDEKTGILSGSLKRPARRP